VCVLDLRSVTLTKSAHGTPVSFTGQIWLRQTQIWLRITQFWSVALLLVTLQLPPERLLSCLRSCAGRNHHRSEDPGVVLTIVNCASALIFLLQIDGLVRDMAYQTISLTKLQVKYESLERAHLALRDLHSGEDMPHAKKARSVNE